MILKVETGDGEDDKVKTTLSKQTKGTYLKSDDKDDKDLAHTHPGPSKGCPSLGRASLTSLGRLDKLVFINLILVPWLFVRLLRLQTKVN